jgi:ADP-heptose:LPS heptosyltransferase
MKLRRKELIDYYLGGFFITILKPVFILVGTLLGRDHAAQPRGDIVIMKMLGGGSLVLALPALLGIREKYPDCRIHLVTTPTIVPFVKTFDLFDQIHLIDDSKGIFKIISSTIKVLSSIFLVDTFIDLEIHSRLTTIFSGLAAARNRIGFYQSEVFWRRDVQTHLVFFNPDAEVYYAYEACANIIGASVVSLETCRDHILEKLSSTAMSDKIPKKYVAVGHACSELGKERMIKPNNWIKVFQRLIKQKKIDEESTIIFLGAAKDYSRAEAIIEEVRLHIKNDFIIACGKYSLIESIKIISEADYFVGIDSSLLHYARLLNIPSTSYWGPTKPDTRLIPIENYSEEIFYQRIPCSPCVHITEIPPCNGVAYCIENLFNEGLKENSFALVYDRDGDFRNSFYPGSIK